MKKMYIDFNKDLDYKSYEVQEYYEEIKIKNFVLQLKSKEDVKKMKIFPELKLRKLLYLEEMYLEKEVEDYYELNVKLHNKIYFKNIFALFSSCKFLGKKVDEIMKVLEIKDYTLIIYIDCK